MKLIALNCNNCGAKLKVGESAKFVTCKHCETQLAIHHEEGSAFTELVEATKRVEERTEELAGQVEELAGQNERLLLQNELEDLDREWERERAKLMTRGSDGHLSVPTQRQALFLGFFSATLVVLMLFAAFNGTKLHDLFWLGAVAMLAIGLFRAHQVNERALVYRRALAAHEAARNSLIDELSALRERLQPKRKKKKVTT
ncbi:MAG: hypothetical protein HOV80_17480 [Polyangiaceae bacterium]|nr:hypothetical protein [Polyangiaceae bacterium]